MKGYRYVDGVATLQLDAEKCNGCHVCETVCPHGVLRVEEGKARIADLDACMECGACMMNCAVRAVRVDPGVGCASAIIASWFGGSAKASCG